ncbi:MAG: hypothetical protein IJZ75_07010 [Clostridia bacterium]|nr:hypothetical protein [Clostridia bacterium]
MKILFFPMFIFALVESKFIKESFSSFWSAKLSGLLIGLILIPVLFYTYTGILGKSIDLINIAIFFLSAAVAFRLETLLLKNKAALGISEAVALITICLIGLIFAVTTFIQPNIPLFIDSATGKSGIKQ